LGKSAHDPRKGFNMDEELDKTYSIALRLRRVVHEDVFVTVFVDDKITQEKEDGTLGIDWDKLVAEAIKASARQDADWQVQSTTVEVHPEQRAKPDGRSSIDSASQSS
jgi:hypothetical protein